MRHVVNYFQYKNEKALAPIANETNFINLIFVHDLLPKDKKHELFFKRAPTGNENGILFYKEIASDVAHKQTLLTASYSGQNIGK